MNSYYRILNNLEAEVKNNNLGLAEGYSHYWREFKTENKEEEAVYQIYPFREFVQPKDFFKSGSALIFKGGFCLPGEKYAVCYDGQTIKEYTNYANRATNFWLQLLLIERGKSFVHGAGAIIKNQGIIFPAEGGVGKTTMISGIGRFEDYKFMGDDFVIIDAKGGLLAYPSDFSVYKYHLPVLPAIRGTRYAREVRWRGWARPYYFVKRVINFLFKKMAGRDLFKTGSAVYTKVPAGKFFPQKKIGGSGDLKMSIWLEKYEGNVLKVETMELDDQLNKIENVLKKEFARSEEYLSYFEKGLIIKSEDFYSKQREILRQALADVNIYRMMIPQNMATEVYKNKALLELKDLISKND